MDHVTAYNEPTRKIGIIVVALLMFPLACKRKLTDMTHFSLIGIIAIFYIVFVRYY